MAKKKKRLIKYNQTIRKIFGGVGFDEGIERVPLDNLIEMAMILSLKEQHLSKTELVRAFRRIWSSAESSDRALITEYLKSLDTTFGPQGTVANIEERRRKIDEILAQIEHTPAESVAIREQFEESKLKKITPKRVAKALAKLRSDFKRSRLEELGEGFFDEDGRFIFYHSFEFKLFDESFRKILELESTPFEETEVLKEDEEHLLKRLQECKEETIKLKRERIDLFLKLASKPNRYLSRDQI
ncbi:MAG: hypothetical protein L3J42_04515, partial [Hydrogenimonas sp.]|nr:hypothetical protein [Hydrogenimonas sp.]